MTQTIQVRLEGDKELLARLKRVGVNVRALVETATEAGAEIVQAEARRRAPGPEIEHETAKRAASMAVIEVGPTKAKWYYRFFEFGAGAHAIGGHSLLVFDGDLGLVRVASVQHPGMAARPFLRPAVDEKQDEATRAMGRVWKSGIEEAS